MGHVLQLSAEIWKNPKVRFSNIHSSIGLENGLVATRLQAIIWNSDD